LCSIEHSVRYDRLSKAPLLLSASRPVTASLSCFALTKLPLGHVAAARRALRAARLGPSTPSPRVQALRRERAQRGSGDAGEPPPAAHRSSSILTPSASSFQEVERISGVRLVAAEGGTRLVEYRIKWKDNGPDSWRVAAAAPTRPASPAAAQGAGAQRCRRPAARL